ncbi:thioredoxin domain-containing protein [Pseudofrankia sp. BMG5.37]|uniref:DsbA family protein n=1 Tax=Pseudofrankia sp. BMG5.37 TaxID=3050035 RepID=UPI002895D970|nr:thioredoxin domain-containing protein [Pseudofrankia sp. BMG5.37]MDT3443036.1 thioredoxin domain-containing protein [Pseudofrankia sp. BMG5.37]
MNKGTGSRPGDRAGQGAANGGQPPRAAGDAARRGDGRPGRDPRAAARQQRAAAAREAVEARERRRRRMIVLASVVGVIIVAAVVGILVQNSRQDSKPVVIPANATGPDNGIVVGKANAPVTVEFYEDFQCPVCKQFETTTGPTVQSLIDDGKIKAVYHMMSFIGPDSVRAANAGAAAAQAGKFKQYHDLLYANQGTTENSGAFTNDKLIELGSQAGLTSSEFTGAVRSGTYDGYVAKVEDNASKRGVTGTPTVKINGKTLSNEQLVPDAFKAAVSAAG